VPHPDLASEQAYLDQAYECLDRMREALVRAGDAVVDEVAGEALDAWNARRLQTFADAERGLCFGRIDVEQVPDPTYIGRRWVHDDAGVQVVVNWQAPAARPFYTATPSDTHGVTLRRRFRTQGRTLLDVSDEALDGSIADAVGSVDDFLLEELEKARSARMRDIVATIQADQYGLIARDPWPPLVVQGGPGTGKTAVGLHRASFLLYTHRDELRRVLLVGPNPTFMDYVSHVLPALGEEAVHQHAVGELVDGVEVTRVEPLDVQQAKADVRMAEVVRRAVEARVEPRPEELALRLGGALIRVREEEVAELVTAARAERGVGQGGRELFRMNVVRRFYQRYAERLGGSAFLAADEVERALRTHGRLTQFLGRVWPVPRAEQVVRHMLGSRERLAAVADGILEPDEQEVLAGGKRGWSDADVPLVDEARALLDGPAPRYGHVIVDEAQDLTPMQLRMISRRGSGSFTILGDIAQATGPVAYDGWSELLPYLAGGREAAIEELRHAYRVPREIMALALPLLAQIAPETEPPVAYRVSARRPRLVHGEPVLPRAFAEAAELVGEEGLLALIVPLSLRGSEPPSLFDDTRVSLLTPREAKGMEFDHVVVVEPAAIVEEAVGGQGLRELYVALTRPTTTLVVVHARPLPAALREARRERGR
jgi:DNA helicase IV